MARTPLHMFGMEYRRDEYLALVASGDHDVNARDLDGKTPLHYAAEQEQSQIVHALLDAGADPNIQERIHGNTPLWEAIADIVEPRDPVIVKMIDHGADPTIVNNHGHTPLALARRLGRSCVPLLEAAVKHQQD